MNMYKLTKSKQISLILITLFSVNPFNTYAQFSLKFVANTQFKTDSNYFSPDRRSWLIFQADGNLVLYENLATGKKEIWNSGTHNKQANKCLFGKDGNLVVYKNSDTLWESKTKGCGKELELLSDGNLIISNGFSICWQTNSSYISNQSSIVLLPKAEARNGFLPTFSGVGSPYLSWTNNSPFINSNTIPYQSSYTNILGQTTTNNSTAQSTCDVNSLFFFRPSEKGAFNPLNVKIYGYNIQELYPIYTKNYIDNLSSHIRISLLNELDQRSASLILDIKTQLMQELMKEYILIKKTPSSSTFEELKEQLKQEIKNELK